MRLFLAGGGPTPSPIPERFIRACGGPFKRIIVLPLTREDPVRSGPGSVELLREAGAQNVQMFAVANPNDQDRARLAQWLRGARGVWVPGGDQRLLGQRLGRRFVQGVLRKRIADGMVYFGTSAGAMLASDPMIEGPGKERDTVEIGPGIGLTPYLIDTHYRERRREARLRDGLRRTRLARAIGLSEGAWILSDGVRVLEAHGDVELLERANSAKTGKWSEPAAGRTRHDVGVSPRENR
jgi:cyanophycinase